MLLTLRSEPSGPQYTLGKLYADGKFLCHTLEDVVREKPGMPVAQWKQHGKTAIPEGTYDLTLEFSPRFGAETLTINNVPGFKGVRMHAGNTENDTEGCPLLGLQVGPQGIVGGTSRPAVALVKTAVRQAVAAGEHVTITIERTL